jgi:hypothetical protein
MHRQDVVEKSGLKRCGYAVRLRKSSAACSGFLFKCTPYLQSANSFCTVLTSFFPVAQNHSPSKSAFHFRADRLRNMSIPLALLDKPHELWATAVSGCAIYIAEPAVLLLRLIFEDDSSNTPLELPATQLQSAARWHSKQNESKWQSPSTDETITPEAVLPSIVSLLPVDLKPRNGDLVGFASMLTVFRALYFVQHSDEKRATAPRVTAWATFVVSNLPLCCLADDGRICVRN